MTPRPAQDDLVEECLRLRRWAIQLLTRSVDQEHAARLWPECSPAAWTHFLATECCGSQLSSRLGRAAHNLSESVRSELARATRAEVQRIMSARHQLTTIDDAASAAGVEPVVLKGGAHVADGGEAFDLGDIDLLLPAQSVPILRDAILRLGTFTFDVQEERLEADGLVAIELHHELDVGRDVLPLTGTASERMPQWKALRRQSASDHLLYCIQHTTTHHPERRGHLRDALLIADAMNDCSVPELEHVRRQLVGTSFSESYSQTFDFAAAMRTSAAPPTQVRDPFERIAAAKYALSLWFSSGVVAGGWLQMQQVVHVIASRADGWRMVRRHLTGPDLKTRTYSRTIARTFPRAALTLSIFARAPFRIVVIANALLVAFFISARYATRWRDRTGQG